jgi:predicted enzyme related to lactoylglutathione lyase
MSETQQAAAPGPAPVQFVWYELKTPDAPAAEAFYRSVVGWGAQDAGQHDMGYTLLTAGGAPVAGLMAMPPQDCAGAQPGWTGVIGVEDADAAASRVTQAGGRIDRPPQDIPGIGRFASAADPQGAPFTLMAPKPGAGGPPPQAAGPGTIGWRELHTSDHEGAFDFYAGVFGWAKAMAVDMGPMGVYQTFSAQGDQPIGGMMNHPGQPPSWLYYFLVEAIDAGADRVRSNGGQVLQGPHEVPGGMFMIQARDPQGLDFALLAPRR